MKIALVGASGAVGSRILQELAARGHQVTAIARDPSRIPAAPGVTAVAGDARRVETLAPLLKGHDAVVSSIHFSDSDAAVLIAAVKAAGVRRYLVVGGAGSLEVAPGVALYDIPEFPAIYLTEAKAGGAFLDLLKGEAELEWTFLSPSAEFVPGERTGVFRLGTDALLTSASGRSFISYEDFAAALVDEIEHPRHVRARFTIGY
ncbi:NAD(P)-dependent oxidoreductase [Roseixanthobacter glucoisosaccharinicivorans]|uniref:NAD(P)-dependent oxidoreductase n=1 Tax=Roseixanthobacter glucoisosaccharinicivorans TaxID=3119923 RepID=UPI003727AA3F